MSRTNLVVLWATIITIITAISLRITNPELVIYAWLALGSFSVIAYFPRLLLPLIKSIVVYLVMIYLIVPYMMDWGHWLLNYIRIGALALVYTAFIIFVCYSFAVRINTRYIKTKKFVMYAAIVAGITLMVTGNLFSLFPSNTGRVSWLTKTARQKGSLLQPRVIPDGWIGTHVSGDGFEWCVPEDKEATKPFPISGLKTTYRIKSDCLVDLIPKKSGCETTSFKVDSITGKKYLLANGTISDKEWSEEEFKKVGMETKAILFRRIKNGPELDVKLGTKD